MQHATTELERARRELSEAETRGAELAGLPALEADARRLLERSEAAGQTLEKLGADVTRANALRGSADQSINHRIPLGESVKVTVERKPIEHRMQVEDAAAESFTSPAVESLQPDLGRRRVSAPRSRSGGIRPTGRSSPGESAGRRPRRTRADHGRPLVVQPLPLRPALSRRHRFPPDAADPATDGRDSR